MEDLSLRTMRSSSGTYSWLVAAREGTEKENPLPARIDLARDMANVWISVWTEDKARSVTSRQVEERSRSERVRVLEVEADLVASVRVSSMDRMVESGFRRFLKGRRADSSSESESARRRFRLSTIIDELSGSRGRENVEGSEDW